MGPPPPKKKKGERLFGGLARPHVVERLMTQMMKARKDAAESNAGNQGGQEEKSHEVVSMGGREMKDH